MPNPEIQHMHAAAGTTFTSETIVNTGNVRFRSPAHPEACSYVRVTNPAGDELAYWTADE